MAKEKEVNKGVMNYITNPNFFEFVMNVMNMENDIDYDALSAEFGEDEQRTRSVGYGNNTRELTYVPSKFLKDRLNEQLQGRWSFIILSEERVTDPCQRYNKQDNEYVDSNNYIKVTAMLVIPGLGVQVQYGVKETFGFNESNDWKAATTDAFKKCCAGFGIEASYEIEDDVDDSSNDENKSSKKSSKDKKGNDKGGKKKSSADLEEALAEIEYDEDELEEALEHEISWGKYRDMTIEEIYEEDEQYLEWIAMNAKEEDDRDNALIVLHAKNNDGKKKKSKKKEDKNSSKSNKKDNKNSSKKSSKKSKDDEEDEDDEERQELIETIQEIFEDDDSYDKVTIKSLIKSVSTNKKHPQGKKSLEELTVKELEALTNVLLEDEDDEEDED